MNHFEQFEIRKVLISHHFHRDLPGFDTSIVIDSKHEQCTHLHKFEENIEGNHIFRALVNHMHIVYAVTPEHDLVLLRAFKNFKEYMKFLDDKKAIMHLISSPASTP